VKIHIPQPCKENWNEMTPQEQGRHCAKCDKVVQDFSQMRDDQIINKVQSGESTCGRFYNWQLQKDIQLPALENPWTSWMKKLAVGGFLFGSAVQSRGQDTLDVNTSLKQVLVEPTDSTNTDSARTISGFIHQPDDRTMVAKRLQFVVDDFNMVIELDSHAFTLDLPIEVKGDSLRTTLFTETDTIELDSIKIILSDYLSVHYDSVWKIETISMEVFETPQRNDTFFVVSEEITTWTYGDFITTTGVIAIPEHPYVEPLAPLINPTVQTIDIANRSGIDGNKSIDQPKIHITSKASKDLIVYNKRTSSVWWWLLPIPVLLFFAGYYWKRKQIGATA